MVRSPFVETLDKDKYYPLANYQNLMREHRAKWAGEYREPKKGEWYLSGAVIEAYRAPNDLTQKFHIAKLYKVRKVEYWEPIDE